MPLDPNRWTLKMQEAFQAGLELARSRNNPEATTDHLLLALLGQEGGIVLPILERVGVAPLTLRNRVEAAVEKLPKAFGGAEVQMARALRDALEAADAERGTLGDDYLSTEHVLLALADRDGGSPIEASKEQLLEALREVRGGHRVTSQSPEEPYQALER